MRTFTPHRPPRTPERPKLLFRSDSARAGKVRAGRTRADRIRAAFTLMEVLLVLAIMGVIMSLVVPKLLGRQQHANVDATRLSIRGVEQALKMYALDHGGRFPSTAEGLAVLISKPDQRDPKWRGPYLEEPPRDAWGTPLKYSYPGQHHQDSFDISSAGPDGVSGNDDDIINGASMDS